MTEPQDLIRNLARKLDEMKLCPVLIGGAALIYYGSDRVTKDFDVVISSSFDPLALMTVVYDAGFVLITKFNEDGTPRRVIEESVIAAMKLKEERPDALFFLNPAHAIRLDLLLDFPAPAEELRSRCEYASTANDDLAVASRDDLRRMKTIAYRDRGAARDATDLLFLGITENELAKLKPHAK